jgi:SAM-dependent methyltransferase
MGETIKITPIKTNDETSRNLRDLAASRMRELATGYAAFNAMFAFSESKLYTDLLASEERLIDGPAAAKAHGYDVYQVTGMLRFLSLQGMFTEEAGDRFRLTPIGQAILSPASLGWLRMIRGGYGEVLQESAALVEGKKRYGVDVVRNGRYVGVGSSQFTSAIRDDVGHSVLERLGTRCVADLGCGEAIFSINFVKRNPAHRAIAVDVDPGSIGAAREAIARAGLSDRIKVVQADCFDASALAKVCQEADTFFTFAMEHELLRDGEEAVIRHVESMAANFPGKRFVIGEAVNRVTPDTALLYWFHVLSLQGMPRGIEAWTTMLGRLARGRLEEVFVPDYGQQAAYYSIAL